MVVVQDDKLVIKHTFLEYVGDDKAPSDPSLNRQRSQTEPYIADNSDYGEVREQLHPSESSSSSSQDDLDARNVGPGRAVRSSSAVLETPEGTPALHPMARPEPSWVQEGWTEQFLPDAYSTQQDMAEYCQWNNQQEYAMCDWWGPAQYQQTMANEGGQMNAGMNYMHDYMNQVHQREYIHTVNQLYVPMNYKSGHQDQQQHQRGYNQHHNSIIKEVTPVAHIMPTVSPAKETRTTVMLRDLPEAYSRTSLLKLLDAQGFFGRFDFIYLPVDFKHQRNLGYALINLVSPCEALRLTKHFEGFRNWDVPSDKICSVGWCSPQQGLEAHVERYRNSPVMHESVPEEWQPMLLSHGVPMRFPRPTTKIKAPKVKGRQA
jgi:hypothetical protein